MRQHLNSTCNTVPTHLDIRGLLLILSNSLPITPLDQNTPKLLLIITIETVTLTKSPLQNSATRSRFHYGIRAYQNCN